MRGLPIGGDDRVAADVDAFGFGLAANFGEGRLVLLFLNDPTHSLLSLYFFSHLKRLLMRNNADFVIYRTFLEK